MAYNITLSDGSPLVTVADGTVDVNFTSLNLVGKNFAGYGALFNENFVYLLENFANNSEPTNPLVGQLWYDTSKRVMKVYTTNNTWKVISSAQASPTQPPNPVLGDQWWDTTNEQLKIWNSTEWKLIGPLWSLAQGLTGAIPDTIMDTDGNSRVVLKFYVKNVVTAIWSQEFDFDVDPSANVPGFTDENDNMVLKTGLTLANLDPLANIIHGTVENALLLDGIPATSFIRNDTTDEQQISGPINFQPDTDEQIAIKLAGHVVIEDTNSELFDIGSPDGKLRTVYAQSFDGVASSARYADLAERFEADVAYEPGTVVELGGIKEVTQVGEELSDNVFGVISTKAAYLMNSAAGNDQTHPPIAVSGRVPVKVKGKVTKGDRLVSAGKGIARAATKEEITPWNVIGRALAHKTDDGLGTVEAIVKLSS
jgi:hypothetical protein